MVAVVENDRVIGEPGIDDLLERPADQLVHHGDAVVILRPVLAHLGCVRVIGRDANLGRVVNLVFRGDPVPNLAFVTDRVVENGEERLALRPVAPVGIAAAGVPDLALLPQIVILLRVVGAVVAQLTQVCRVHFKALRQAGHAAHVLGAGRGRVDAGDDRRARRCADRGGRAGIGVAQTALGQAIDVGGGGVCVAVAAKVHTIVLAGNPEDVR